MKRSVLLNSTSAQGKKLQKSFTDVNPEATGQSLKTFAQKVNGLTTATYNSTDMVDKYNLDTETPPNPPTEPTLSLTKTAWTMSQDHDSGLDYQLTIPITYNGDGDLYIAPYEKTGDFSAQVVLNNNSPVIYVSQKNVSGTITAMTFTLGATATDNYKAASLTFTVAP